MSTDTYTCVCLLSRMQTRRDLNDYDLRVLLLWCDLLPLFFFIRIFVSLV